MQSDGKYLPTLDGWRAIAILLVILAHSTVAAGNPRFLGWANPLGERGVEIFFALSGFLITRRMLEEHDRYGRISLTNFYIRRAFRILPCVYLYLAVLLLVALFGGLVLRGRDIIGAAFFFRNYTGAVFSGHLFDGDQWYTAHFWSLSIEEHFYILWPAFLIFAGPRRCAVTAGTAAFVFGAWRLIYSHTHWTELPYVNEYFRTDLRFDYLLWGCFLAGLFPVILRVIPDKLANFVSLGFAVLCIAFWFQPFPLRAVWQPLTFACMVVATTGNPKSILGTLLETRLLRFIGKRSYSLYVWHIMFLVSTECHRPLGAIQRPMLGIPLAFVAACASYQFVEKPCLKIGKRLLMRRTI
jgi:peptidoglycan/LPS O-acetylase OafA/YrhL